MCKECNACHEKFEIGLNAGFAFNSVPGINNDAVHTRSSGAHFTGDLYGAWLINTKFAMGVDVAFLTLAYKDDVPYAKPAGTFNTYNDVYLAKPVVPIQLFGRVSFGTGKLTSQVSLSAGYALVTNSQVQNNNILLNANPGLNNGFTAALGIGFDYFFNCKWGIGANVKADYFSLSGNQQTYNLFAFPISAGIRYRF